MRIGDISCGTSSGVFHNAKLVVSFRRDMNGFCSLEGDCGYDWDKGLGGARKGSVERWGSTGGILS